jgi:hypothetical protein
MRYGSSPEEDAVFYKRVRNWVIAAVAVTFLLISILMAGCPQYNRYQKEQAGKAELQKAESSKQVAIEEAKANLAAEQLNAEAEVARAKGAAKAIAIEGGRLTDEYIKYLWVRQQKPSAGQVIYVPTEAGLPILEAGQR